MPYHTFSCSKSHQPLSTTSFFSPSYFLNMFAILCVLFLIISRTSSFFTWPIIYSQLVYIPTVLSNSNQPLDSESRPFSCFKLCKWLQIACLQKKAQTSSEGIQDAPLLSYTYNNSLLSSFFPQNFCYSNIIPQIILQRDNQDL